MNQRREIKPGSDGGHFLLERDEAQTRHQFSATSPSPMPKIVCLCGSTRFKDMFMRANLEETMQGNIVLSVGSFIHSDRELAITDEQKEKLDVLHKRKIDLADEIFVLNVEGYVGSSTASEVAYAYEHGKDVRWLTKRLTNDSFARVADALNGEVQLIARDIEEVA